MTDMMQLFRALTARRERGGDDVMHGKIVTTISPVANDYHSEELPKIPAGVDINIDFGGDFGIYGVAVINGVLNKVKVELNQLHLLDWSNVQDIIDKH